MSTADQPAPGSAPGNYDIASLLKYDGPSLRQQSPIPDGMSILDYRNTDENERNITTLLSSQGIPFTIERPPAGLAPTSIRLSVTVPRSQCQQAEAVLAAGVAAAVLDRVEGLEGLLSR